MNTSPDLNQVSILEPKPTGSKFCMYQAKKIHGLANNYKKKKGHCLVLMLYLLGAERSGQNTYLFPTFHARHPRHLPSHQTIALSCKIGGK